MILARVLMNSLTLNLDRITLFLNAHLLYFQTCTKNVKLNIKIRRMATSSAKIVLSLYKSMVRESQKFVDFNYRCYAIRRIKDSFKSNAQVTDQVLIDKKIDLAKQNLQLIQRQVTIGQLFGSKQQLSVEVPKD